MPLGSPSECSESIKGLVLGFKHNPISYFSICIDLNYLCFSFFRIAYFRVVWLLGSVSPFSIWYCFSQKWICQTNAPVRLSSESYSTHWELLWSLWTINLWFRLICTKACERVNKLWGALYFSIPHLNSLVWPCKLPSMLCHTLVWKYNYCFHY